MSVAPEAIDLLAPALRPEPKRDRWGRYLIPGPDGKERSWQRVTTLAKVIADTYALEQWSQRQVALGLALRDDLFARVASCTADDREALNEICADAKEAAGASKGRNAGTALHRFTERLDRGETVSAPPAYARDLDAYRACCTAHRLTVVDDMLERTVVVPDVDVAGTFDKVMAGPAWPADRVADLKTGQEMYGWLEVALQLACYAHAEAIWDTATGTFLPMPPVDRDIAVVLHLPSGQATCTVYEVDIAKGWELAQLAAEVRDWRKRAKTLAWAAPGASAGEVVQTAAAVPVEEALPVAPPAPAVDRDALIARATAVLGVEGGGVNLAAAVHQRGLGKLKEATDADLPRWEEAIAQAERALQVAQPRTFADLRADAQAMLRRVLDEDPFVGLPGQETVPPSDPAIVDIIHWGSRLPADLLEQLNAETVGKGMPNLRSGKATRAQVDQARRVLDELTADHADRVAVVRKMLAGFDGDERAAMLAEVSFTAEPSVEALTAAEAAQLGVLCDALDRGVVCFDYSSGSAVLRTTDDTEAQMVAAGGSRSAALDAAKATAERLGLTRPRSVAAAAHRPILAAHLTAPRGAA